MSDDHPVYRCGAVHTPLPASILPLAARADLDATGTGHADWLSAIPAYGDALGNAATDDFPGCGDCVWVWRRWTTALCRAVAIGDLTRPTAAECIADYSSTGYDPATRTNDNGTDTTKFMARWCRQGFAVNDQVLDIRRWATIDPTNWRHVSTGIRSVGPCGVIWNLPVAMQDISTWAKPPGQGSDWTTTWAQHATTLGATDGAGITRVRTWGMDIDVHPDILTGFAITVFAPVSLLSDIWFGVAGITPLVGLDVDALTIDIAGIASATEATGGPP
jgi:hypothetical protein